MTYIREMTQIDSMYQEKKKKEDSPAFKLVSIPQFNDKRTAIKRSKERQITTTGNNINCTMINRATITNKQK